MATERLYIVNIVAKNAGVPINELNIELPEGFRLSDTMIKEIKYPEKNWDHVFDIQATNRSGVYPLRFFGKDEQGNNISFIVDIKVAEKESLEFMTDDFMRITSYFGLFVFIVAVLRISGVIK